MGLSVYLSFTLPLWWLGSYWKLKPKIFLSLWVFSCSSVTTGWIIDTISYVHPVISGLKSEESAASGGDPKLPLGNVTWSNINSFFKLGLLHSLNKWDWISNIVTRTFFLFGKELFKKLSWGSYFSIGKNREKQRIFFLVTTRGSAAASGNETRLKSCPCQAVELVLHQH